MKLYFSWKESTGAVSPDCRSSIVNKDGFSPLACLLTDDGGQVFLDTISWLDEGLDKVRSVKDNELDFADWSRDAWGAELSKKHVKIYSLYDEGCFELMTIKAFEVALSEWLKFVKLTPELGLFKEVEI